MNINNKDFPFHLSHYLILIIILSVGLLFFFLSMGNRHQQMFIALIFSGVYLVWGIVHHYLEGNLHPKIVVEYLLIALLAVFLLRGAIYR